MAQAGVLAAFLTAGWPSGSMRWLAERFPRSAAWQRLLARAEPIPDHLVHAFNRTELLFKGGDILLRPWSQVSQQRLHNLGFRLYASSACKVIKKMAPDIYHYRSCYGRESVDVAKKCGAIAICDHSAVHPVCLQWMADHLGQFPPSQELTSLESGLMPLYHSMLGDLARADCILVNSEFARATCVHAGIHEGKVRVAYLGVDRSFVDALDSARESVRRPANSLLYAGGWRQLKGVFTLVDALAESEFDWQLDIAGGNEPEVLGNTAMRRFLSRPNVRQLGILPRGQLAALMKSHRLFVFPSYCEGSARVVFEALAAGCYVITTPNSGSIVEDGIHGALVPAGDSSALGEAIGQALADPRRMEAIGKTNAELIRTSYLQRDYGRNVREIYEELCSDSSVNK